MIWFTSNHSIPNLDGQTIQRLERVEIFQKNDEYANEYAYLTKNKNQKIFLNISIQKWVDAMKEMTQKGLVELLTFESRAIPNVPPVPPRAVRRFHWMELLVWFS